MKRMKRMTKAPMVAALMCVALLITSLFLPYMQVTGEYAELAEAMEMDTSISLYSMATEYMDDGENSVMILLGILGGMAALAALLAFLRKPVGVILLSLPITAEATLIWLIFSANMTAAYERGIAGILIFAACGGMLISGIWMAVKKSAAKKHRAAQRPVTDQVR